MDVFLLAYGYKNAYIVGIVNDYKMVDMKEVTMEYYGGNDFSNLLGKVSIPVGDSRSDLGRLMWAREFGIVGYKSVACGFFNFYMVEDAVEVFAKRSAQELEALKAGKVKDVKKLIFHAGGGELLEKWVFEEESGILEVEMTPEGLVGDKSKKELLEMAEAGGIEVSSSWTKLEIARVILKVD